MTSVEVPYSIACALPSLTVLDITNDVAHEVAASGFGSGIAYVSAVAEPNLVRVNEREGGLFADLEEMLARFVPVATPDRGRLLAMLLGPRTEQIPFERSELCLGRFQRILLFGFEGSSRNEWAVTLVG